MRHPPPIRFVGGVCGVKHLRITFPLLSNLSGYVANYFGAEKSGQFLFERMTIIVDKKGVVRYMKDGSPNFEEIIAFLKKLNEETLVR